MDIRQFFKEHGNISHFDMIEETVLQKGDSEFFSLKDAFMKKSFFEMEKTILENYLTEYSTMFQ